jgi:chromosome segregation ATPase
VDLMHYESPLMERLKNAKEFYDKEFALSRENFKKISDDLKVVQSKLNETRIEIEAQRKELSRIITDAARAKDSINDHVHTMSSLDNKLSHFEVRKKTLESFIAELDKCQDSFERVSKNLNNLLGSASVESLNKLNSIISETNNFDLESFKEQINRAHDFDDLMDKKIGTLNDILSIIDSKQKKLESTKQSVEQFNEELELKERHVLKVISESTRKMEEKKESITKDIQAQWVIGNKLYLKNRLWAFVGLLVLAANLVVTLLW